MPFRPSGQGSGLMLSPSVPQLLPSFSFSAYNSITWPVGIVKRKRSPVFGCSPAGIHSRSAHSFDFSTSPASFFSVAGESTRQPM